MKILQVLFNKLNLYSKHSHATSDYLANAKLVRKRDNLTCQYCGQHGFTVHHIVPLVKGGTHHPKNLVTVCKKCHQQVHQKRRERTTSL